MHGKDLFINDGGDGETVEAVRKGLPKFNIVAPFAFIVEAVDAINAGTLVVPTEDEKVFRVLYLVGEEEADGL